MMSSLLKWFCCIHPCEGEIEVQESVAIMSNPDVVYINDKLSKIVPGRSFLFKGVTLRTCERFSINFVINHPTKDIALHFNPRLPQNYIVRNCKINGSWGTEEVTSPLKFSLFRGQPFAIQFLVTEHEFYISINGRHFASFRHRLPYDLINIVQVKGDVSDITMLESLADDYPDSLDFRPQIIQHLTSETEIGDSLEFGEFLDIPYYGKLEHQFLTGCEINIKGRVKLLPHSFYINLQQGIKIWPHPGIPFHFNPRFANIGGKHIIVRNSWYNGKWDREEVTQVTTDFFPGKEFLLTIRSNDASYTVYLNQKLIAEYPFRTTQYNVNTVYIQGDIHLYNVWMKNVDSVSVLMFNTNFSTHDEEYVMVDRAI